MHDDVCMYLPARVFLIHLTLGEVTTFATCVEREISSEKNEEFNRPVGIAIHYATGDVYVSDYRRIYKITAQGMLKSEFEGEWVGSPFFPLSLFPISSLSSLSRSLASSHMPAFRNSIYICWTRCRTCG